MSIFSHFRPTGGSTNSVSKVSGRTSLLGGAAMMLMTIAGAGAAHATVFAGNATFADITTGNALTVQANPNPNSFSTTNLVAGGSDYMTGFMTLTTQDPQKGNGSCFFVFCSGVTNTDQIGLTFAWTQPGAATNTSFSGDVEETTFNIARDDSGELEWANDTHQDSNGDYVEQMVTFSDGAIAKVDLYDTAITGTTSSEAAQFDVRITDVKDPTKVPEPASIAVLGAGMLGLGYTRRRKAQRA